MILTYGGEHLTSKSAYTGFAKIYDEIMSDVPYDEWFDYIELIWSRHGFSPDSVLDLACGTGSMTLRFARQGYKVTGIDSSRQMLDVAVKKARNEGLYVPYFRGDMRDFELNRRVDAVICLFDSLNYLLQPSDVRACFKSVFNALNPGGCFVFDVNTPFRLSTMIPDTSIIQGPWYFVVWRDTWDEKCRWWQVNLTGFLKDKEIWRRFDEVHRERAFPVETLAEWLKQEGFTVKRIYDSNTLDRASDITLRAYFVAWKPGI